LWNVLNLLKNENNQLMYIRAFPHQIGPTPNANFSHMK
jgi:hypothetical protein